MTRATKDAPSAQARRLLAASIKELRAQLKLIADQRKALGIPNAEEMKYDDDKRKTRQQAIRDLGNTTAALARAMNSAAAEMRKLDTYDAVAARKLSPEERYEKIVVYVEDEMTSDFRRLLLERLNRIEAEASSVMGGA